MEILYLTSYLEIYYLWCSVFILLEREKKNKENKVHSFPFHSTFLRCPSLIAEFMFSPKSGFFWFVFLNFLILNHSHMKLILNVSSSRQSISCCYCKSYVTSSTPSSPSPTHKALVTMRTSSCVSKRKETYI